jgi:hypothetical protein
MLRTRQTALRHSADLKTDKTDADIVEKPARHKGDISTAPKPLDEAIPPSLTSDDAHKRE